jgi:hypothetical protein
MCKPLTVQEWKLIQTMLASVAFPPEGIDIEHTRSVVRSNITLAESRELQNAKGDTPGKNK